MNCYTFTSIVKEKAHLFNIKYISCTLFYSKITSSKLNMMALSEMLTAYSHVTARFIRSLPPLSNYK